MILYHADLLFYVYNILKSYVAWYYENQAKTNERFHIIHPFFWRKQHPHGSRKSWSREFPANLELAQVSYSSYIASFNRQWIHYKSLSNSLDSYIALQFIRLTIHKPYKCLSHSFMVVIFLLGTSWGQCAALSALGQFGRRFGLHLGTSETLPCKLHSPKWSGHGYIFRRAPYKWPVK